MRFLSLSIFATLVFVMLVAHAQDAKPAETKPETKPAETKPQDTKPQDTKPADAKWPVKVGAAGEDIAGVCAKGTPIFKWSEGHNFTEGPACAPDGTMYFTDLPSNQILQLDPAGAKTALKMIRRYSSGIEPQISMKR